MKRHFYLGYVITEFRWNGQKEFKVELDQSWHNSLTSAQVHIDYLTK